MDNRDRAGLKPQAATDLPSVIVPTIQTGPNLNADGEEVMVQWFGQSESLDYITKSFGVEARKIFESSQFHFPVPMLIDDLRWMGHPEHFRVLFIGQLKDWPNPQAISSFKLPPETWILYIRATHYETRQPTGGSAPPAFAMPLRVSLADSLYGIIHPKPYRDMAEAPETPTQRTRVSFYKRR